MVSIGDRTTFAPARCVIIAIARNCASTSNVFCRNIDNSENGEGGPFQLRKLENRSFWKNEEVTNEGLKVGCLLEYRVVRRRCKLDEGDEEQFIFHRIAGTELQVSFHYYTNSTVVSRFFEKFTLPQCLRRFRTPPADLGPPSKLLVFQFSLHQEFIQFFVFL